MQLGENLPRWSGRSRRSGTGSRTELVGRIPAGQRGRRGRVGGFDAGLLGRRPGLLPFAVLGRLLADPRMPGERAGDLRPGDPPAAASPRACRKLRSGYGRPSTTSSTHASMSRHAFSSSSASAPGAALNSARSITTPHCRIGVPAFPEGRQGRRCQLAVHVQPGQPAVGEHVDPDRVGDQVRQPEPVVHVGASTGCRSEHLDATHRPGSWPTRRPHQARCRRRRWCRCRARPAGPARRR